MTSRIPVFDLTGNVMRKVALPRVFETPYRPDLIQRAVIAIQSHRLQPQGRDIRAGKRTTAESLGAGHGLARIPRVKGWGYPAAGRGAFAPGTVGGRQAFPPTSRKDVWKKINKKEKRLATKSAIAATAVKELVAKRGHNINQVPSIPLVVSDEFQELKATKEVVEAFENLGVWPDVERAKEKTKIRAGKGKMRGRRLKKAKGPLVVVAEDRGVVRAASNLPGVDVIVIENLNVELLAPGAHAGRFTIWTESAFKRLDELFP